MKDENFHLMSFNNKLQEDIIQTSEATKIARDSLESKLQLKIQFFEESTIKYTEVTIK